MRTFISYLATILAVLWAPITALAQFPQGIDPSGPDKNIDFWESPEFIAAVVLFILLLIFGLRWSRKALKRRDEKREDDEEDKKDGTDSSA